ncbi:hypothetical protein [Pigmentiphaga litoralis]|uniref:hypothetical protein n=1 Tax=Pigmentiphaga litoralis TaxID=516702 RepID=UPI003B43003A
MSSDRCAIIRTGLVTAVLVLVIGGLGSLLVLAHVQCTVENDARQDAGLLADSVARTLVQQFEKAGRYGIPFDRLPGVQGALQRTLDDVPGLATITLTNAAGATLNRVDRAGAVARDTVRVPIAVAGEPLGAIAIGTAPAELAAAFDTVRQVCAITTVLLALLAGIVAAVAAGALLDRRRAQLRDALSANAAGRFDHDLSAAALGRDAVAMAFRALADGQAAQRERREAFDAYAQELLAVDFDGSQRELVAAWSRVARGMTPVTSDYRTQPARDVAAGVADVRAGAGADAVPTRLDRDDGVAATPASPSSTPRSGAR